MSKRFIRKPRKGKFGRKLDGPKVIKLAPIDEEAERKKAIELFRSRQKDK